MCFTIRSYGDMRQLGWLCLENSEDRNQMFWPIFACGPWPETFKASFSLTNQTANKRQRQKKRVKIFLNFTYLHKTQPGQKTAGNFPNFFRRYLLTRCLGIQVWMPL